MMEQTVQIVIGDSGYELLSKQLQTYYGQGLNVVAGTEDGKRLYELVEQYKPQVLLIDVFLTNIDGLEKMRIYQQLESFFIHL